MKIGLDTTFLIETSIREHPAHTAAMDKMFEHLKLGDHFAIAPQVMAEFIHVVSDPKRFEHPLSVPEAIEQAKFWWNSKETEQVMPDFETMVLFWDWMSKYNLGRKRILDTMLAATYFSNQINTVISSNARDYAIFNCFKIITC